MIRPDQCLDIDYHRWGDNAEVGITVPTLSTLTKLTKLP